MPLKAVALSKVPWSHSWWKFLAIGLCYLNRLSACIDKTQQIFQSIRRSSSKKSVSRYFWCLQRHLWAAKFEFNIRILAGKIIKFKFIIEFKFSRSQVALQASKISGYTLLTWTSPTCHIISWTKSLKRFRRMISHRIKLTYLSLKFTAKFPEIYLLSCSIRQD